MLPVRGISGAIHTEERMKSRSLLWPLIRMNPALQTQLNQNCCFLLEMGQPRSWAIIKMHCLRARSAWIFKITMKVEYWTEVSLDFITKTYILPRLTKETGLGSWLCGYRCTTYIQQDLYQHSSSQHARPCHWWKLHCLLIELPLWLKLQERLEILNGHWAEANPAGCWPSKT